MKSLFTLLILLAGAAAATAQDHQHSPGLDARGKKFMGFDQQATTHHFILTKDGGRIEVTARKADDTKSISEVRNHLTHIASVFAMGDFNIPALVHDKPVPGVEELKRQGAAVTYSYKEVDGGGFVRLSATSSAAVAAIHEFLRFQIKDHGTGDPLIVK